MTEAFNRLHHRLFCLVIKSAGCFIKNDIISLFVKRACNTDPLPLPSRETDTPLSAEAGRGFSYPMP
jgi:hypothetical protein